MLPLRPSPSINCRELARRAGSRARKLDRNEPGELALTGLGAGWWCEAVEHQPYHRPLDHRFVRFGEAFVVAH